MSVKEEQLRLKEEELQQLMKEYYLFDMGELRAEIDHILNQETTKIDTEKAKKLKEIQQKFQKIMGLSNDHIAKNSEYRVDPADDERIMDMYERHSEQYEEVVHKANEQKQSLRTDISKLESTVRKLRDQLADKNVENKNLEYLIEKEMELKDARSELESQALQVLSEDLNNQMQELQVNQEAITGKVTPFHMEQVLEEQYQRQSGSYQAFLDDSERDVAGTEVELAKLKDLLMKEQFMTEGLRREQSQHQEELDKLGAEFNKQKKDLDELLFTHKQKQDELNELRLRANDEIKHLSVELGKAQSEINILILETRKYEGLANFMETERQMILQAKSEAEGIDPVVMMRSLDDAEKKREELQNEINQISNEWMTKIEQIQEETERNLGDNELAEFRTRIAILVKELNDKNNQIEQINSEKEQIEKTADKAVQLGFDIKDQTVEIEELNKRYHRALKDKVSVYDELVESVKDLVERNSTFMRNEVQICKLSNDISIMKRELEQKEKVTKSLKQDLKNKGDAMNKDLLATTEARVQEKSDNLFGMHKQLREKDIMIEQLEQLLRAKESQAQEIRLANEQGRRSVDNGQVPIDNQYANVEATTFQKMSQRKQTGSKTLKFTQDNENQQQDVIAPTNPSAARIAVNSKRTGQQIVEDEGYEQAYFCFVAQNEDPVEVALQRELQGQKLAFPIKQLDSMGTHGSYYLFGTRKIFVKMGVNQQVLVRDANETYAEELHQFMINNYDDETLAVKNLARQHRTSIEGVMQKLFTQMQAQIDKQKEEESLRLSAKQSFNM